MRWCPSLRTVPSDCSKNQVSPGPAPQGCCPLSDHVCWPGSGLAPTGLDRVRTPCSFQQSWWGGAQAHLEASTCDQVTFSSGNSLVRHNVTHLSRIYPAGWRTDSSNYSPMEMWNGGCQIGMDWLRLGGLEDAWMGVLVQRARDQEPLGTQAGPDAEFVGSGAGDLSLEISLY